MALTPEQIREIQAVLLYRPIFEKYTAGTPLIWQVPCCICQQESTGNRWTVNPDDPSWGPMQITHDIAAHYGNIQDIPKRSVNPLVRFKKPLYGYDPTHQLFIPDVSIRIGTGFLLDLQRKWAIRYPQWHWIVAYNEGEGNLLKGLQDPAYLGRFITDMNALQEYLQTGGK